MTESEKALDLLSDISKKYGHLTITEMYQKMEAMQADLEAAHDAMEAIQAAAHKDGIHKWHEESDGELNHDHKMIRRPAGYYVDAGHLHTIADTAKQTLTRLARWR